MPISFYLFHSKLTPIPFNLVFFISVYSSYIHLYIVLSLFYPTLFLYTSFSIQIDAYLFLSLCLSKFRAIFSNPFSLSHSNFCIPTYICFYLFSIHLYFFIPLCQSRLMPISFYLFVYPNSRQYLSNPFSLSHSKFCIPTYICFYLFSIQFYFFIPLCQSRLMSISFNSILFISA